MGEKEHHKREGGMKITRYLSKVNPGTVLINHSAESATLKKRGDSEDTGVLQGLKGRRVVGVVVCPEKKRHQEAEITHNQLCKTKGRQKGKTKRKDTKEETNNGDREVHNSSFEYPISNERSTRHELYPSITKYLSNGIKECACGAS